MCQYRMYVNIFTSQLSPHLPPGIYIYINARAGVFVEIHLYSCVYAWHVYTRQLPPHLPPGINVYARARVHMLIFSCVYACMRVCMTCIHTVSLLPICCRAYIYAYARATRSVWMCIFVFIFIHACIYMYVKLFTCVYVYMCVCIICMYVEMYTSASSPFTAEPGALSQKSALKLFS